MDMNQNEHYVFVYGTLKSGEPSHKYLIDKANGDATFISNATTKSAWPLVIASRYNIPFLIYKSGLAKAKNIHGQVYKVDDKMFQFLDKFENHPTFYKRVEEKVVLDDGKELDLWIYFLPDVKPQLLELEMIANYSSYGDHGLRLKLIESEPTTELKDIFEYIFGDN